MKNVLAVLAIGAALAVSTAAHAWPDKIVTMVVPFPPGGSTDTLARSLAQKMQERWAKNVVVDNRPGATGIIAAGLVKRAAPDGYTLFVTSLGPLVIVPHLVKEIPYDAAKDFDYLTVAVQAPNVLVVPGPSPYKSVAEVIAAQKAQPGKITFGSSGNGSSDHLSAELFWLQTGTSGVHVPYKGGALVIGDLLGSHLDASFQNINVVIPQVGGGKLRALAITSNKRSALLPSVPTMGETGVKEMVIYSWQAVLAPKGLPADVKAQIHAALIAAINDPQVKQRFVELGFELVGNTPEQFVNFQQQESARWKNIIETRHITVD